MSLSDPELLYFTLVQDAILPHSFLQPFLDFYATVDPAAKRDYQSLSKIDNASAAVALHLRAAQAQKNAPKPLPASPAKKLTLKFKHSLEKALCSGPTARRDAEELERRRWIDALAQLLLNTPTPMGRLLSADPSCRNVLGGGRRVDTIRSRVRSIKKFLSFVTNSFNVPFPSSVEHYAAYLRMRLSEPCTRGALQQAHFGISFLEEVCGVQKQDRITHTQLHEVIYAELLASAIPGKPLKQAPPVSRLDGQRPRTFRHEQHSARLP